MALCHNPAMPDKQPSKAEQYRKRAEAAGRNLKHRVAKTDRAKKERKKKALEDMAADEDGKPGSQLKPGQ
jgi:hypothetical protein